MPQDQKFRSRFYRGQDRAEADFPALVTEWAVAVFITGLIRTHYRNLSAVIFVLYFYHSRAETVSQLQILIVHNE